MSDCSHFSVRFPYMEEAILEAKKALLTGDCPIGAIIVKDDTIIGRGHNQRELHNNVTLHAEMVALSQACASIGHWSLKDCDIYVSLEPCIMCAGAILQARMRSLYFGAFDEKAGAAGGIVDVFHLKGIPNQMQVYGGIMEDTCTAMLKDFFADLRQAKT